jgi:CHAT domain-containing protein
VRCSFDQGEWVGEIKPLKCLNAVGAMPKNGVLPFHAPSARELHELLIAPFAEEIGDRHMILVADDALSSLPFHVLLGKDIEGDAYADADWLGLKNPISVLPSVSAIATLRRDARMAQGRLPYLGVANPLLTGRDGDDKSAWAKQSCRKGGGAGAGGGLEVASAGGAALSAVPGSSTTLVRGAGTDVAAVRALAPLPETADEVCQVAETVGAGPGDVVLGEKASEAVIKRLSREGRLTDYRLLHFATHGLVAGELSALAEPALVMTPPQTASREDDGLLTATEVAALQLDADWVVLSACNTAAGEELGAEALSGLARSFFYAGARSMLVSHWPVQSDAAVKLTTIALSELRKDKGVGRAEALRRAMAALVGEGGRNGVGAHPQVWAPFVVVGEGGPLSATSDVAGADASGAIQTGSTAREDGDGGQALSVSGTRSPSPDTDKAQRSTAGRTAALVPGDTAGPSGASGTSNGSRPLPVRKPAVPREWMEGYEARRKAEAAAAARRARRARAQRSQAGEAERATPAPKKPWGERYWEQNL